MRVTIHQPEFLPWLGFIDKMRQCDTFVLLDSVQFEKNYFQNRNKVRTSQGFSWITVPVITKGRSDQLIQNVEILPGMNWKKRHLVTLYQSYGKTPFFNEFFAPLEAIYQQAGTSLADLNCSIIAWLARCFKLTVQFVRSSSLAIQGKRSELLANICEKLHASAYLSGVSGRDYLDESFFKPRHIRISYQEFSHPTYRQCYSPFLPMMSSLDLLFNTGPEALSIIEKAQLVRSLEP